jgi:hypothetical protein
MALIDIPPYFLAIYINIPLAQSIIITGRGITAGKK